MDSINIKPQSNTSFQNTQQSNKMNSRLYNRQKSVSDSINNPQQILTSTFPTHQDKENFYPQAADLISRKINSPGPPTNHHFQNSNSIHSTSSTHSTSSKFSNYSKLSQNLGKPMSTQTLLCYFGKKEFKPGLAIV